MTNTIKQRRVTRPLLDTINSSIMVVCVGQSDYLSYITVEVVRLFRTTEGELNNDGHLDNRVKEASYPTCY